MDAKPAGSSDSDTPRNQSPNSDGATETQPSLGGKEPRPYRQEPWHECFTTVNKKEFDALIYSLYVMARDDKKLDGYEYYECINRLQSKCRYRVRARRMNEFIIVEERGAHNHAMEPIVLSYEDWNNAVRQEKLEEEVRRLGLPHNPRLGRQVDNRIAYLRRVKNLNEMKKIQDQVTPMPNGDLASEGESKANGVSDGTPQAAMPALENPADLLQMLMQNGRFPELNGDTQSQLMALMMGGAVPPMRVEDNNGGQDMLPNPSVILPSLLANPFLHAASSSSNCSMPIGNLSDSTPTNDPSAESGDMEEDDDYSTEDGHLQIDADH
ncbi:hypothetical protein OSTOST_11093 [Ostertagia ostertagi]